MDHISKEHRSWNMSRIRSKNTKPEMFVRSFLHVRGLRFRLDGKINKKKYSKGILPGRPDIVLSKYNSVIFVHGCFWHQHKNCKKSHLPKSNTDYWKIKLKKNVKRDSNNTKKLKDLGFNVFIIWECEIKNTKKLEKLLDRIKNVKKI